MASSLAPARGELVCLNCGRKGEDSAPLGRPQRSGDRQPMGYCYACLSESARTGVRLRGGGREARRRSWRAYRIRVKATSG